MKRIIVFFIFLYCLYSNAQVPVYLSQLKNTSWKVTGGLDDTNMIYSFSDKEIYWYSISGSNITLEYTYLYYLTDNVPQSYDSTLVGKSSSGCYIVKYNPQMDEFIYYIIKSYDITKGTMTLLPRSTEPLIGGMASEIRFKLFE